MDYGGVVVTDQLLREKVVLVLDRIGKPTTPGEVYQRILSGKLLPYRAIDSERVFQLIMSCYRNQDGVFFKSRKGNRRFGLQKWRESPERHIARRIALGMKEFLTKEFVSVFKEELDREVKAGAAHLHLSMMIEDGLLERVKVGLYRVVVKRWNVEDETEL